MVRGRVRIHQPPGCRVCGGGPGGEWLIARDARGATPMRAVAECDDRLETRRTVTLVMLGLAVVLPGAVMFVGGRRE